MRVTWQCKAVDLVQTRCAAGSLAFVISVLCFVFVFQLNAVKKVSQDLFLALSVMLVSFFSEKRAELVFAHCKTDKCHDSQYVFSLKVKRYLEFLEDDVVIEFVLRFRLRTVFLAAHLVDKAI